MPVSAQGSITHYVDSGDWLICRWYNAYAPTNTVEVMKYTCPEGTGYDQDAAYYAKTCTTPSRDGIEFTLTGSDGIGIGYTAAGKVTFENVPVGPVSIQERIPDDFGQPVVVCHFLLSDAPLAEPPANKMDATNGYLPFFFDGVGQRFVCNWYNIPEGPSDITIHKYWCPPGYDLSAWGADPLKDCTEKANGITFTLEGPGEHPDRATTGDPLDGAIRFDKLEFGTYVITEIVPADTASVFVLDCYGQHTGELRPYPLDTDNELTIDVSAGESIVCHWYNVPEDLGGRLTVYKYTCSTMTFVSEVDCELIETGVGFDLVMWDGYSWGKASEGITDGGGMLSWGDLAPGEYWLDEQPGDWCHLTSEQISDDGNWLNVYDGDETVVRVYNCSSTPGDQGKPGKTPAKYPNTGVPPLRDERRLTP